MGNQPQWLTPTEREAWLGLNAIMTLLPATLDSDLQNKEAITLFDYSMLAMLSEEPGQQMSMTKLASLTSASLSRLSHVVKKLENRGWVKREQAEHDARVKIASLTAKGMSQLEQLAPHHVGVVRNLVFDSLDDKDVNDLRRISRKIISGIEADHWLLSKTTGDL